MQNISTLVSLLNNRTTMRRMQRLSKKLLKRRKQKGGIWYLLALAVGSVAYATQRKQINRGLTSIWKNFSGRLHTKNEPTMN